MLLFYIMVYDVIVICLSFFTVMFDMIYYISYMKWYLGLY